MSNAWRERERDRETDRETERQIERQRDRETETSERERERERESVSSTVLRPFPILPCVRSLGFHNDSPVTSGHENIDP